MALVARNTIGDPTTISPTLKGMDHFEKYFDHRGELNLKKGSDLYNEVIKISQHNIVQDPVGSFVELSELKRSHHKDFDTILKNPLENYDYVLLLGTHLSSAINSGSQVGNIFDIEKIANGLCEWMLSQSWLDSAQWLDEKVSGINDDLIDQRRDIVRNYRQALPVLLINLATAFRLSGDNKKALEWNHKAIEMSSRLGTMYFTGLASIQAAYISGDRNLLDHARELSNISNELAYSKQKDINPGQYYFGVRFTHKVDNLELYLDGLDLLRGLSGSTSLHLVGNNASLVHSVLSTDSDSDEATSETLIDHAVLERYIERVQEQKRKFITHLNTDGDTTFEHSDIANIAMCEILLAKIGFMYMRKGVSIPEGLIPYTEVKYWSPDNPYFSLNKANSALLLNESRKKSVLTFGKDLYLPYEWMSIFNMLYNYSDIQGSDKMRDPVLKEVLTQIAKCIAGLKLPAVTISNFFNQPSSHQDNPVVAEFKTIMDGYNLSSLPSIPLIDSPEKMGQFISPLGKTLRDLLLGPSGHDDVISYLDSYLGGSGWAILYADARIFGKLDLESISGDVESIQLDPHESKGIEVSDFAKNYAGISLDTRGREGFRLVVVKSGLDVINKGLPPDIGHADRRAWLLTALRVRLQEYVGETNSRNNDIGLRIEAIQSQVEQLVQILGSNNNDLLNRVSSVRGGLNNLQRTLKN